MVFYQVQFSGQAFHFLKTWACSVTLTWINAGCAGSPAIAAWNYDLSSSYYDGGAFIQRKTSPERAVIRF
jgi:hypothetical protein